MRQPDRILNVPQWVGCLLCLLVAIPWAVGVVSIARLVFG